MLQSTAPQSRDKLTDAQSVSDAAIVQMASTELTMGSNSVNGTLALMGLLAEYDSCPEVAATREALQNGGAYTHPTIRQMWQATLLAEATKKHSMTGAEMPTSSRQWIAVGLDRALARTGRLVSPAVDAVRQNTREFLLRPGPVAYGYRDASPELRRGLRVVLDRTQAATAWN